MPTRTAGAALASVLVAALFSTTFASPAQGNPRRLETCFGEDPTIAIPVGETVTYGTEGSDVIMGGVRVEGLGGDDLICDADYIVGGPGDDRIRMLNGGTARGNGGDDEFISVTTVEGAEGPTLIGGPGRDVFWGGPLAETMYGGSGADVIRSGGGNDLIDMGSGRDQGFGGPGFDRFDAGNGDDYIDGGDDYDVVAGGKGKDRCLAVEDRSSCRRAR